MLFFYIYFDYVVAGHGHSKQLTGYTANLTPENIGTPSYNAPALVYNRLTAPHLLNWPLLNPVFI